MHSISLSIFYLYTSFFFFNDPATTEIYTLSLHDALPISRNTTSGGCAPRRRTTRPPTGSRSLRPRRSACSRRSRSEEHTSELQSRFDLVCRLLLEKKKKNISTYDIKVNTCNTKTLSRNN